MLAVAELLSEEGLDCALECTAFGAEECGWYSLYAYLEPFGLQPIATPWGQDVGEVSPVWLPILANINMDGIGELLGLTNVCVIAGSPAIGDLMQDLRRTRHPRIIMDAVYSAVVHPASRHHTGCRPNGAPPPRNATRKAWVSANTCGSVKPPCPPPGTV